MFTGFLNRTVVIFFYIAADFLLHRVRACVGWETTERMLRWGYEKLANLPKIATVT